ncbi:MAG: TIGR02996 domain-containing protein [Planctomycetales bacterium]
MDQERAFREEILAAPEDDAPRLIFADWLEERGDPRGDFIRAQCELARLHEADPRTDALRRQQRELIARGVLDRYPEWPGTLANLERVWFRRGFPDTIQITPGQFLDGAETLFEAAPLLRGLKFTRLNVGISKLAECPFLERIVSLNVAGQGSYEQGLVLANSPFLHRLESLNIFNAFFRSGDAAVRGLVDSGLSERIHSLECGSNDVQEGALSAFAASKGVPWRNLGWFSNRLTASSVRHLMQSPRSAGLHTLNLGYNSLGIQGLQALAKAPRMKNLKLLNVNFAGVTDAGIKAISKAPWASELLSLHATWNQITDAGVKTLLNVSRFPKLCRVDLRNNDVSPMGKAKLRERFGSRAKLE